MIFKIRSLLRNFGFASLWLASTTHAQVAAPLSFEVRTPVGVQLTHPENLNEGIAERLLIKEVMTFGGDFLVGSHDWYAGLRFDSVSAYKLDGKNLYELAAHLFSAVVQRRYQIQSYYFAPTIVLGLYTPAEMNVRLNGGETPQYKANRVRSGALSLEGGWIRDVYLLGGEIGYHHLTLDDFGSSANTQFVTPSGAARSAQLSGPFAKFILGLHF